MQNKLSITSRILAAFASGALVAVFFLPVWRIDLFAPQYPDGLTMNIWINGLSGDVDVINGLNHYIGMKHISVAMFPEFKFLPFVVAFFLLLGIIVAITGSRKLLLIYLLLTVLGGALAMYDFYNWGYDYGHDLDPKAPIQIPDFSYQPPLLGHKRLLNFDAYSMPHVGGWIVIAAAVLAFAVWFGEWYHQRKQNLAVKKGIALASIVALIGFSSCNTGPEPFTIGKDECHFCKMTITDNRYGGELITRKGRVHKFDDLHCMISFLKSGGEAEKDIAKKLVIDFEKPNTFIAAETAAYLSGPAYKSPMGSNTAGFSPSAVAQQAGSSNPLTWSSLQDAIK